MAAHVFQTFFMNYRKNNATHVRRKFSQTYFFQDTKFENVDIFCNVVTLINVLVNYVPLEHILCYNYYILCM